MNKYLKDLTNEEFLEILKKSKSLSDVYKSIGLNENKISGTMIKEGRERAIQIGFDIDLYDIKKQYYKNPKRCVECNKIIEWQKGGIKEKIFCSHTCSAKHSNRTRDTSFTKRTKKDTCKICKIEIDILNNKRLGITICELCQEKIFNNKKSIFRYSENRKCLTCGCLIRNDNKSGYCQKHLSNSKEYREKLFNIQMERIKNGTHKGWTSRNVTSYPEKFFINVLKNNNLLEKCQTNYPIKKDKTNNYFLDFFFEDKKIDLEIDGKQHGYKERIESDINRDKLLKEKGINVYRIKWKSINTEKGKTYIKEEIEKFLSFYNSL